MTKPDQTYGIVAAGGKSERMGTDKAFLVYYGKPQIYHMYDELSLLYGDVFISCNKNQEPEMEAGYQYLTDRDEYADRGPISVLLTAFATYPAKNFLIAGCDYPYLNHDVLKNFLSAIPSNSKPMVFYNEKHQLYEPLIGWYPVHSLPDLVTRFNHGRYSLQSWLKDIEALRYIPADEKVITSINTPGQYEEALQHLKNEQPAFKTGKTRKNEK